MLSRKRIQIILLLLAGLFLGCSPTTTTELMISTSHKSNDINLIEKPTVEINDQEPISDDDSSSDKNKENDNSNEETAQSPDKQESNDSSENESEQAENRQPTESNLPNNEAESNKEPEQQTNESENSDAVKPDTSTETEIEQPKAHALNQFEQEVVRLTNEERKKHNLNELKIDISLSKVAREKSNDMKVNNYFSHTSPTYGSPFDMMAEFGISYRTAGENIAMGQKTPKEVVNAWMNSDGHRANILKADFTHIGVGFVKDGNYWTQQFIGK